VDRGAADLELVARLMAGDSSALAEIYDRYSGLVYALARRVLGDDALAEDITQEVFVFVWEYPQRFDPARGSLRAWLGLLAHRRSVDRVRAEVRRTNREAHAEPALGPISAENDVDDRLSLDWLAVRVREGLDRLPAEQREALVLAYYGARTHRQVADELAIPEGTAKSRLRLALKKLNEILGPSLIDQDAPAWI
jgi:RNA polymerase sigma factor (sigma-70 family)